LNKNKEIGRKGELLAAEYLINRGYQIIQKNFRKNRKEIDIIAQINNTIVFVEVKTRLSERFGPPEDSIDDRKIENILDCANDYIQETLWKGEIRFDIITVKSSDWSILNHIQDAFY